MRRALSSAVAVSRSSAARRNACCTVHTLWPSFSPSSQIGYQMRSASSLTSTRLSCTSIKSMSLDGHSSGPAVAADGDQRDARRGGLAASNNAASHSSTSTVCTARTRRPR